MILAAVIDKQVSSPEAALKANNHQATIEPGSIVTYSYSSGHERKEGFVGGCVGNINKRFTKIYSGGIKAAQTILDDTGVLVPLTIPQVEFFSAGIHDHRNNIFTKLNPEAKIILTEITTIIEGHDGCVSRVRGEIHHIAVHSDLQPQRQELST